MCLSAQGLQVRQDLQGMAVVKDLRKGTVPKVQMTNNYCTNHVLNLLFIQCRKTKESKK
jgi:hypothetical protein